MIKKPAKYKYLNSNKLTVDNWNMSLEGIPCFILGNAPSIDKYNLNLLKNFFTIGINRIFYKFDPTILIWQDLELWHTDKHGLLKCESIKYCRDSSDLQGRFFHYRLVNGDYKLTSTASILNGRGSTGPLAFQLAYVLGCNPIVLLGMDCKYSKDGKTDFYGVNPMHKPHTLRNCTRGLNWILNCQRDRKVVNCSDNSVFEKTYTLEQAISLCGDRHIFNRKSLERKILFHGK